MNILNHLYILKTASSEVKKRTLFKNSDTIHVPDLFFALCFATLFFAAQIVDKIFIILMFFSEQSIVGAIIYAAFTVMALVCSFGFEKNHKDCIPGYEIPKWCSLVLIFIGCGPFLICGNALKNSFENQNNLNLPMKCYSFPMFYIKNKDMWIIKLYYFFNLTLKSIPQLYVLSVLIMKRYITGALAIFGLVSLVLNMVIFSLTMAVTLPLRSKPRVYTTSFGILLGAFCKFMATLCGCVVNLAMFAMLFSKIGYYAILTDAIKALLWIWPSWWALKTQSHALTTIYLILYLFFLTLIFSFIYIHPFEKIGRLVYYFFYLVKFCSEIFCIYVLSDACNKNILIYLILLSVMIGQLSCYNLIDNLQRHKLYNYGCEMELKVENLEENENETGTGKKNEKGVLAVEEKKNKTEAGKKNLKQVFVAAEIKMGAGKKNEKKVSVAEENKKEAFAAEENKKKMEGEKEYKMEVFGAEKSENKEETRNEYEKEENKKKGNAGEIGEK